MTIRQDDWIENTGKEPEGNPMVVVWLSKINEPRTGSAHQFLWAYADGEPSNIIAYAILAVEPYKVKRWRAEGRGEYWYVDAEGVVLNDADHYDDFDNDRHTIGNYFRTREEAEADLAAQKKMRGIE